MSSYRRLNGDANLPSDALDVIEFTKLASETDSAIQGFEVRLQASRSDRDRRQIRQKFPSIKANIASLQSTLDVWASNLRKWGLTERDIQSRSATVSELHAAFTRLQQNAERTPEANSAKAHLLSNYVPLSRPVEDNEQSQYLSNKELLDEEVERAQFEDTALDHISQGLTQLNYTAKAQNKQLLKQEGLITDLGNAMDGTDERLQSNLKRVEIVEENTRGGCCSIIIIALILAIIVSVIFSNWMCHILPKVKNNMC